MENLEDLNQDVDLLSKRNRKRFGKFFDSFAKKYSSIENKNKELENTNRELEKEIKELKSTKKEETPAKTKKSKEKELLSEYELARRDYIEAQLEYQQTKKQLYPHSSATTSYGSEIVWFSVVVGLVFDFLLWKDIFAGKFGEDIWAERAERASAIIMSFAYAFVCAQLGTAYAIKMLVKKRVKSSGISKKEKEVYNKSTAKETLGINIILFSLLTILSTAARFSQQELDTFNRFILSLAATTVGLVISAIAYWYTDVYDHFIKAAKNKEQIARKNFLKISKKENKNT